MVDLPIFPIEASTIAIHVDLLLTGLVAISTVFTLIVLVLMVYFGLKYRRGKTADRSNPPLASTKIELAWIFGLILLSVGAYTWATVIFFNMNRPPEETIDISVVGLQWMWKFQHADGQREINELHVPVGYPVRLVMTSQDVIHSFFVPAFRLKNDVIPGRYTELWFEATKTGEFHLFCAEYCGTNHAEMIGKIIVMDPRAYQEWLGGQPVGVSMVQAGEELFTELGCSSCHVAGAGVRAPTLAGMFGSEVRLASGETVVADEAYIRESILFPQEKIVTGYDPIMPSYQGRVSEEQIMQLIAYIRSLSGETGPEGGEDENQ
jgi:cytochrome c oxidase subunit 2